MTMLRFYWMGQSLPMILSRAINMTWNVDILILFDYYPMWGWQMTVIAMHWMSIIKSSKSIYLFQLRLRRWRLRGFLWRRLPKSFRGSQVDRQHCRLTICRLVELVNFKMKRADLSDLIKPAQRPEHSNCTFLCWSQYSCFQFKG